MENCLWNFSFPENCSFVKIFFWNIEFFQQIPPTKTGAYFQNKVFLISPVYFLWSIWVRIIFKREIWCVFVCLFMCVYICVYVCVYVCVHLQTKRNGIIFCVEGVEERRQYFRGNFPRVERETIFWSDGFPGDNFLGRFFWEISYGTVFQNHWWNTVNQ